MQSNTSTSVVSVPAPLKKFYDKYKNGTKEFYFMELLHQSGSLIRLHRLDEAIEINREYEFSNRLPQWFAFGDDGGDELVCVNQETGKVALIPISPTDEKHAMLVDHSIDDLFHHSTRIA